MPLESSEKPAAPKRASLLLGFFLFLLFASLGGWLAWSYASDAHLSRQYHHALGCFPGTPTDSSLPPCRNTTLLVTRQWEVTHSKSADDENLDLQELGGRDWIESVSYRVWKAAPVGSRVSAQIWKGQVVRIWAGGLVSRTDDNPDHNARQDLHLLGEFGFLLLLGSGILPAAFANWLRRARGLPVSREIVYAVQVRGDCLTLADRRYTHLGGLIFGLLALGSIGFFTFGVAITAHDLAGLSWPVLAAGLGVFALLASAGRRTRFLALRLPALLLMLPFLAGRALVSYLGREGRILLSGDRWTFDRNRDRVSHDDRPIASLGDVASVQLKESKSARGSLRRGLKLLNRDGTEIGAGMASDADAEETEYVAERLADFLGCPLQRLQEKDEDADAQQAKAPTVAAYDPQRLEVPYTSTFADLWRTNLFFMGRRPGATVYNLLALPVIGGYFWLPPYFHQGDYGGAAELAALMLAGSAAFVAALTALFILLFLARRSGSRQCRFVVGAEGFEDVMPEKTSAALWRDVNAVEQHGGDIYFFRNKVTGKGGAKPAGTFLPRSAFANPAQAQAFYETARRLWQQARDADV